MHSVLRFQLFTPDECARVLVAIRALPLEPARADGGFTGRSGSVAWLYRNRRTAWIFERIERFGLGYAKRHGIDASALAEPLQFAEYGRGAKFEWHIDTGTPPTARRKITVSTQLSDPAAYDGGDLEFVGEHRSLYARFQGNAMAFSSALGHRVTRIRRGRRRSLIGWVEGEPYR
jgi:PKHD-type hydroxylase